MRNRSSVILVFAMIVAGMAGVSCATTARTGAGVDPLDGDSPPVLALIERQIYVELPDSSATSLMISQKEQYDRGRRIVSHTRQRCAKNAYNREAQTCSRGIDVQITAVEGAKYIDWAAGPRRPQLIAWFENLSPTDTTFDGLVPGRLARYALVVDSGLVDVPITGSTVRRPRLVLVRFNDPARHVRTPPTVMVRSTTYGHVFECHRYRQPFLSDVDFRPCDRTVASTAPAPFFAGGQILATSMVTSVNFALDDPVWFSCKSGCCTSGYW